MMQQATAYYKILADGQIAGGIIVFDLGNERYELGRLFVAPAFQDRGIGTRAMGFIERAHPAARCWQLGTPTWAVRNQHFLREMRLRESGQGARRGGHGGGRAL